MDTSSVKSFYANSENLRDVLAHFLSIFSEGRQPNVPFINNLDGSLNVKRTFELACYREFPSNERMHWLTYVNR